MKIFRRIAKWLVMIVYFLCLTIILLDNNHYAHFWNIPVWIVPTVAALSIICAGYSYIMMYLKVNVLEFEFTSIVNHTFRTPLTKIIWALKELKPIETDNQKQLYLQNIENSADRILDIVDILVGIQDVNNRASYFFKPTSVRQILEKSITKYREIIDQKKFNFKIELFTDIPPLTTDLRKMSFVFDAIMENALHYTPEGGNITIGTIPGDKKVTIFAKDDGIGMSFRDRRRIFSKFYRSSSARVMNTDGMGLSLYLAKKILEKHDGKIYVKTNPHKKGVTFFVELPVDKSNHQLK